MGGYESACHLMGWYPPWWDGRIFGKPIRAWVAGKNSETTRDIVQQKLFGNVLKSGVKRFDGTGLVMGECVGEITWKRGTPDLADTIKVKSRFGGWSTVGLKSYEQGRGTFEGTERELIWFDEEPPVEAYSEALIRTMTTQGIVMMTFTPLEGMSDTVLQFLPDGIEGLK